MYKARMMDSGDMTGTNIYNYCYSFISLLSIHTVLFLSELNSIYIRTGDTSNPYLTSRTN